MTRKFLYSVDQQYDQQHALRYLFGDKGSNQKIMAMELSLSHLFSGLPGQGYVFLN